MGASLCHAVRQPELITTSQESLPATRRLNWQPRRAPLIKLKAQLSMISPQELPLVSTAALGECAGKTPRNFLILLDLPSKLD